MLTILTQWENKTSSLNVCMVIWFGHYSSPEWCLCFSFTWSFLGLAKIHGTDIDFLQSQLMEGVVKKWALDPNTMGAFLSPEANQVAYIFLPLALVKFFISIWTAVYWICLWVVTSWRSGLLCRWAHGGSLCLDWHRHQVRDQGSHGDTHSQGLGQGEKKLINKHLFSINKNKTIQYLQFLSCIYQFTSKGVHLVLLA